MKISNKIQLTYIPSEYWKVPLSGFKTKVEKSKFSNFFLMWNINSKDEAELNSQIKKLFPTIPINKLPSCEINLAFPNGKNFMIRPVFGKIVPVPPALNVLFNLEIIESYDIHSKISQYSDSVKTWAFVIKMIFELLNRGNFIPDLEYENETLYNGQWRLILKTPNDQERFKEILKTSSWAAHNLPINFISESKKGYKTDGIWHPSYIYSEFMDRVGDFLIRSTLKKNKFQAFEDFYSLEIKKEKQNEPDLKWDYKLLKALISQNKNYNIKEFHESIIPSILQNWVQTTQGIDFNKGFSLNLELKYPKTSDDNWPLELTVLLQDTNKNISITKVFDEKASERKKILKFFDDEADFLEYILRILGIAANIFPPIRRGLEGTIPEKIELTSSEVMDFMKHPRYLLVQSGFKVILPDVFTSGGKQRLSASLVIKTKEKEKVISGGVPSMFQMSTLLDFKWEATLEDKILTDEEFNKLIENSDPLIKWRDDWVLIDQQDIEDLRTIFQAKSKDQEIMNTSGQITYMEALKLGLTGNLNVRDGGTDYDVVIKGDLNDILNQIKTMDSFQSIETPKTFKGTLRSYQQVGLNWLANMCSMNFGLCLADDMGLGKTIQVIAFLLHQKEKYPKESGSILIVCPTSVLFNWVREINKFGPDLDVILHHGPKRIKDPKKITTYTKPHRIILTSFGTIRNDIDLLETITFSGIVIDESQNMKNFSSQQTKAILKLKSGYRICLSGTPVENRLMELWTLFEFLNPALLGKRGEFQQNFVLPIERFQDQEATNKLKRIIAPFLMRRVKSDSNIIDDLPEKNEMKVYLDLSDEQIKIYKNLVDETLSEIQNTTTDQRKKRGLVLGLLTKLKQICNHPYQYLKQEVSDSITNKDLISQSKKLKRLKEMVDEVVSNGNKILIFTQFRQMGDIILELLKRIYEFEILYFHGSVPAKKRKEIVDEFQSDRKDSSLVLIVSLKAGGTGLNLTRGTTVVHFDRWWNPAVEDQATDRAYRIGQTEQVNVYKYITVGTIEEKIDALLEEKRDLADKVVASTGESWISDLSEDKLKDLLTLDIEERGV